MTFTKPDSIVGVIGSGSFGVTLATLLSKNTDVLLFSRHKYVVDDVNQRSICNGILLNNRVRATSDIEEIAVNCKVLFPVVPSESFRNVIKNFASFLKPYHTLIHGTKGFDVDKEVMDQNRLSRKNVFAMSEVIRQETSVVKIGCLAGPNLSKEILNGQPTATVVASQFEEVIHEGQELLGSSKFFVFGSYDLKGAELAGALKNIVALASGIVYGLDLGKNLQAMVITRGLAEMIHFGKSMGAKTRSFLGTAGIGDLVATATSPDSRNFNFGKRIGQGESMEHIQANINETAEGVRTLKIANQLISRHKITAPITQMLYKIIYEHYDISKAIDYLMNYPYGIDVEFIDREEAFFD